MLISYLNTLIALIYSKIISKKFFFINNSLARSTLLFLFNEKTFKKCQISAFFILTRKKNLLDVSKQMMSRLKTVAKVITNSKIGNSCRNLDGFLAASTSSTTFSGSLGSNLEILRTLTPLGVWGSAACCVVVMVVASTADASLSLSILSWLRRPMLKYEKRNRCN